MLFSRQINRRIALSLATFALTGAAANADSLFNYNVVVTGTYMTTSHVDGATFANNVVAANQPVFGSFGTAPNGDTLDVAGSIFGGATIQQGVFRTANPLPGGFGLVLNGGATHVTDPTVSLTSLAGQMTSDAAAFNSQSGTTVHYNSGAQSITFTGTTPGLDVFNVSASDLQNSNENVIVNLGSASNIVINVSGSSFTFGNSEHVNINGGSNANVLWNFAATNISLNDPFRGSILAPSATLSDNNQNIDGGVYVANFTQTAEVHVSNEGKPTDPQFSGSVPPGNTALVVPQPQIFAGFAVGAALLIARIRKTNRSI